MRIMSLDTALPTVMYMPDINMAIVLVWDDSVGLVGNIIYLPKLSRK